MGKGPTFGDNNPAPQSRTLLRARRELIAKGVITGTPDNELDVSSLRPQPVLTNQDRITVQFAMHHEHIGATPVSVSNHYTAMLEHREQPYVRRIEIDATWRRLDIGWLSVDKVGCIVIENRTSCCGQGVLPTEDQVEDNAKQLLCLVFSDDLDPANSIAPDLFIRPDRFVTFEVADVRRLWVRAADKPVNANIVVFPK